MANCKRRGCDIGSPHTTCKVGGFSLKDQRVGTPRKISTPQSVSGGSVTLQDKTNKMNQVNLNLKNYK